MFVAVSVSTGGSPEGGSVDRGASRARTGTKATRRGGGALRIYPRAFRHQGLLRLFLTCLPAKSQKHIAAPLCRHALAFSSVDEQKLEAPRCAASRGDEGRRSEQRGVGALYAFCVLSTTVLPWKACWQLTKNRRSHAPTRTGPPWHRRLYSRSWAGRTVAEWPTAMVHGSGAMA